jgi:hypothetical protein
MKEKRMEKLEQKMSPEKIVKEITEPKIEKQWNIKDINKVITAEEEVAEIFNRHFTDKIEKLKTNIVKEYLEEPLERMRTKMSNKNLKSSIKTVSEKKVAKVIRSLSKTQSAGRDSLSQENLILGKEVLKISLTRLMKNSIENGEFPKSWKEAVVTAILDKESPKCKENYRPVSCLHVASKVQEKIVCDQITKHIDSYGLLPENQLGFR